MNDIPPGVPEAAPWSLFAGALGRGCVVVSLVFFVLALAAMLVPRTEKVGIAAFVAGCVSLFLSFGSLVTLFLKDQFQYAVVWQHSAAETSPAYKVAAVWTMQEGSFLLWACGAAVAALLSLRGTGPYRRGFVGTTSLFLGSLGAILAIESPFRIMKEVVAHGKTFVPLVGNGMTPSLQNYWVVIHPPTIFFGFGTLSVLAAYAVAAMLRGDAEDWVARVRPWALVSLAILAVGISMGGLWAYETQGWGGFWAWDPVENVSFVPWLFVVVFAHGILVQAARRKWAGTNLWLGGLPFLAFVYGTYLTRSGLLDKVSNHSFATMDDNARGVLKGFLIASFALFAAVYFARGRQAARLATAQAQPDEPGLSRENLYRYGMLFVSLLGVVIALGMSWPVITAMRGGQGSKVDEGLYHLVVVWFFLPLMALMAVAPFVSWRRMEGPALRERLFGVACVSVGVTGLLHLVLISTPLGVHLTPGSTVATPFGGRFPLALWMLVLLFSVMLVVVANVWRAAEIARRSAMGAGGFVAHLGLAVLLGGLILSRGYERSDTLFLRPGAPGSALGYTVAYKDATSDDLFDRNRKLELDVTTPEGDHYVARPGHYQYGKPSDPQDMTWPAIQRFATHDVYLNVPPPQVTVTDQPIAMKPGDTKDVGGASVEYLAPTRKGEFGQAGTSFGVKLRLTATDKDGVRRQYLANPTVTMVQNENGGMSLQPSLPHFGPDFQVAILGGVNAADKSAQIMLFFSPPIYQATLYEKPFTGLVWLGTGILFLGGMMSAVARRRVVATRRRAAPANRNDAPLPAPQG